MKKELIKINDIQFEYQGWIAEYQIHSIYRTIHDAYEKPSKIKIEIWEDWKRWFEENGGYCWISSYNCMTYSIKGIVYENNRPYLCWITKEHNRIYSIAVTL